jgi:hypothetical protein
MHPRIRVDKLHPDGSPRASWEAYRIEDCDGAVRIWTPAHTTRIHVNGRWTPASPILTAWKPGEPFVAAVWEEADDIELYIDIVREVSVTSARFAYVDLYVDVMYRAGRTWSKDDDLAAKLEPDEARQVLERRDALVRAVSAGDPPFRFDDPRWQVPAAARTLPPGDELTLA